MKNAIKLLSFILVVILMAVCATGCGEESGNEETAKSDNTIIFATNAQFAPFEYVVPGKGIIDHFDGIDIAIAHQIAKDMGKTVKMENTDFNSLFEVLNDGRCDAVIAGISATEDRAEDFDFSKGYYKTTQVMLVKADSAISCVADLKRKKIAVIDNYTGEAAVKKLGFVENEDYTSYTECNDAILGVINGKCDALIIDYAAAKCLIAENNNLKIVEDTETFESEEYAIAVKKGNRELLEKINASIDKMLNDGTISGLFEKYVGE